jgi:hypothetical protein
MKTTARAIAALVLLLVGAGPAEAANYESPAAGTVISQSNTAAFFDWTWATGEYAASIYFCPTPAPEDPCWKKPARKTAETRASSAGVDFGPFTTGTWYWRLCVKSIYSEEDVCDVQVIRPITVVPASEGVKGPVYPTTAPALSKSRAQRESRKALKRKFGNRFTFRTSFSQTCKRRSKTGFTCRVEWSLGRKPAYSGRVAVGSTIDGLTTRVNVQQVRKSS